MTQPDPMDQPEDESLELAFPFVACQSNGGLYDDESFTAGYQCGRVDSALAAAAAVGANRATFTVTDRVVAQVELIAMHHGFTTISSVECEETPEWSFVTVSTSPEADL